MKSHGVEFTLSTRNIRTKDFSWNTDFIFSYAKNEVTQLKGLTSMMELVSGNGFAREGYPVRGLFSIPFAGLDADGIPQYLIDGKLTTTGVNFQEREKLDYLKYEGDKMSLEDWTETSIKKILHLREVDERNEFYLLAQAHICILGNRMDEAKWLLESYNYNRFAIGKDVELSSYYLYLTTKLSRYPKQS